MEKYQERAKDVLKNNQKINLFSEALGDKSGENIGVITRCLVDCCEVTAMARNYYEKTGFPVLERKDGSIIQGRPSNILIFDEDIRNMWSSMKYMMIRNNFTWGRNKFLNGNRYAENMYSYLISTIKEGNYELSDDDYLNEIKKELISSLMGTSYILWNYNYYMDSTDRINKAIKNLNDSYSLCKDNFSKTDMSFVFTGDLLYDTNQSLVASNLENLCNITPTFDRKKQSGLAK